MSLERLFQYQDALSFTPEVSDCFLEAIRESLASHLSHSEVYRRLSDGFEPGSIKSVEDLSSIPYIMVNVFKRHRLLSVPEKEIAVTFTSSGTGGETSCLYLDELSARRQGEMRNAVVRTFGLVSGTPVNYLSFSYSAEVAANKGAAHAHEAYTHFAPTLDRFFALHAGPDGKPVFDAGECIEVLQRYETSGHPLRITGFPAFLWRTLQEIDRRGLRFCFSRDSLIFNGGGWKTAAGEQISRELFLEKIRELLRIPADRVRDVYGMVEHGVPYLSCEEGNFHIPIYSRVFARDPNTLAPLEYGRRGLLNLISPYNRAMPAISVLSTDWGAVHRACKCGRGEYLQPLGRAGVAKHHGCAITASELLKR